MNNFSRDYKSFLESEEWGRMRRARLAIDDYKCQCCGAEGSPDNPLQVHHLRYGAKAGGREDVYTDLVTCCKRCHTLIHNGMNRVTNAEGRRGWADDLPRHIRDNLAERGLV